MHELITEVQTLQIGKPFIGHRYLFEQLPDALALFRSGKTIGKVVVLVS